ncbi:sugar ABC transporter substrate-binding protein [Psychromonas sp. MB-3u-54]|uniref:substrate-binding domain-containing protein n=1 Tax=Psychromonas sp. MB-3u-54 TaxID=2058319 RepID=UPI000C34E90E|nr:substrate-binding domain-containing protein [Psychromonas sp. MB-3u-54]PKH03154.1 sugar ABC transporter substrate-binding protein [Psychromonas sp. MB-3u-54]
MKSIFCGLRPHLYTILTLLCSLIFSHSALAASQWNGPRTGPSAKAGKTIVYVAEDLKNAGVLGVGEGVREAARVIGWNLVVLDIGSLDSQRARVYDKALKLKPDGLIFSGGDALNNNKYLQLFANAGIPVAGWHVSPFPGPVEGTPIFINITTDSLAVTSAAANYAIEDSSGKAGVVIFTDLRYRIAIKKAELMADIIRACPKCTLLSVEDVAIDNTAKEMPQIIPELLQRYGNRWTHAIAINDLYFDHAVVPLILAGKSSDEAPINISAGDGSPSAFMRIRNHEYQAATIPEPLLLHGWQLIDELNRRFTGENPSGYVNPPYTVTTENIDNYSRAFTPFDPDNNYRRFYTKIWLDK